MILWMELSILTNLIILAFYGYIYYKCYKLAMLSVVIINLIELGYGAIGKYSYYFVPIEIGVIGWCAYIIWQCNDRKVQAAMIISIIAYAIKRLFFESYGFLGGGTLIFIPLTIYWLQKCCIPRKAAKHEALWGDGPKQLKIRGGEP